MKIVDFLNLVNYEQSVALCEMCRSLFSVLETGICMLDALNPDGFKCPYCGVTYLPSNQFETLDSYLKDRNLGIFEETNAKAQVIELTRITKAYSLNKETCFGLLLEYVCLANEFIHFTTHHLDLELIGILKMASRRVPVRGLLSGNDEHAIASYNDDCPNMMVRLWPQERNGPYPLLRANLIVDGVVVLQGASNQLCSKWGDSKNSPYESAIISCPEKVMMVNNYYFAPKWAQASHSICCIDTAAPF